MTTRRANGEGGQPRLRKDGRWQASYTGADGRRHYITIPRGSTVTACHEAQRAAIRQAEDGHRPTDGRLTVGEWLTTWMRDHVAGGTRPKRPGTAASDRSVVEIHLRPRLGHVVLSRLTREQVTDALVRICATGVSPKTTRHAFHILRIAINEAVRSEKVRSNVCLRVTPPAGQKVSISPWDADEINRFLDSLDDDRFAPLFTSRLRPACGRANCAASDGGTQTWRLGP